MADAVARALRADPGSVLAFLPGQAEIRRTETLLKERVADPAVDIVTLYGALDAQTQDRAIAPAPAGRRKVVLATSIAETSLTIEGVRIVIDSGLARVPRYEPDVGLTRLETVRVSRAAADQRRGRAGRTEPGVCYRLWDEPQTASLEAYARPEMLSADLSGMLLDLAQWGAADPARLAFLDPPPPGALAEARALLIELGAIDADGRITEEGRKLRRLPLPPRLARMVVDAAARRRRAARCRHRGDAVRARAWRQRRRSGHRLDRSAATTRAAARMRGAMAKRWADQRVTRQARAELHPSKGRGRIKRRCDCCRSPIRTALPGIAAATARSCWPTDAARNVDPAFALAREPFLAVAEMAGTAAQSRILLAAPITLDEIEQRFADRIERREDDHLRRRVGKPARPRSERLGAITLAERPLRSRPTADGRGHACRRASRGSASTGCRGRSRCGNGATG